MRCRNDRKSHGAVRCVTVARGDAGSGCRDTLRRASLAIAGGMVMGAPLVPPVSRITQIMTASVPHDSARRVPSCCPGPWCMRCDAVDGICLTASLPRGREFGIENGELEM